MKLDAAAQREVVAWANERIASIHLLIENPDMGADATAMHRGSLITLRLLVAEAVPAPPQPNTNLFPEPPQY